MYGSTVCCSVSKSYLEMKYIQNVSLRICLGCPKTTLIQAMKIELIIPQLLTKTDNTEKHKKCFLHPAN